MGESANRSNKPDHPPHNFHADFGHHHERGPRWDRDDDECPFGVVDMTPPPDSAVLVPRGSLTLEFSEPVDPASVDETTVVLRVRESKRTVPVTLDVVGSQVTITPQSPLGIRGRYWIEVDGVAGAAAHDDDNDHQGNDDDDDHCTALYAGRFFTDPNFETLYLRYIDGVENRAAEYSWDPQSMQLWVDFTVPGADGEFLTADDVQDWQSLYQFGSDWDVQYTQTWNDAGPDGQWNTGDEFNVAGAFYTYAAAGLEELVQVSYGADGMMGTADDALLATYTYFYDGQDLHTGYCDGSICGQQTLNGGERQYLTNVAPGADGIWMTADDVLGPEWIREIVSADGTWSTQETHELAADGTPTVTPTSLNAYFDVFVIDDFTSEVRSYLGPGADGIWRTADDLGNTFTTITYDAGGLRETMVVSFAGPDGLLDTADDVLYQEFFY